MGSTILTTERLRLRLMTRGDLDFLAEMLGNAEVRRFFPNVCDREQARESMERNLARYEEFGHGFWIAELKSTGQPIGNVGLLRQEIDGMAEDEIGYTLNQPFWQQGYASEAAAGVRDYAFGTLKKRRLISLVRPINIPSQRTALRIGMKPEKVAMHAELEHIVFAMHKTQ